MVYGPRRRPCKADYRCTVTPGLPPLKYGESPAPKPDAKPDPKPILSLGPCFRFPNLFIGRAFFHAAAAHLRLAAAQVFPERRGQTLLPTAFFRSVIALRLVRHKPLVTSQAADGQGVRIALHRGGACGSYPPAFAPQLRGAARLFRCRSSVVEHPLGKGEVECSIHSGSTTPYQQKSDSSGRL